MIRIYIVNLGSYNRCNTVGRWIELPMDEDEINRNIKEVLSPIDEEIAIHDYEHCDFFKIGEYDNIFEINKKAEIIELLKDYEVEALKAICELVDFDEAIEKLRTQDYIYIPEVSNNKELGEHVVENGLLGIKIPESLENYIDYEAIGRDWAFDYDFLENGGAINLF